VDELQEVATGILRMGGLPRLKLFLRFDHFDRFVSAILLAPRDHLTAPSASRFTRCWPGR
jgi:NAD-specific glutamate dehydrogenase